MKKKSIILLSSILAGSLLVGGAFAAYAVTDNADPFGINVTPGETAEDHDTHYVKLSWGESTNLKNVTKIQVGENRKVGVVELKTDTVDYSNGTFTIDLVDQTKGKPSGQKNLKDYLNVYLYANDVDLQPKPGKTDPTELPTGTPLATIEAGSEQYSTSKAGIAGSTTGTLYSIFVQLDNSANPYYSQIYNDILYLRVDWAAHEDDVESSRTVYFNKPSSWGEGTPNIYAWVGKTYNEAWPGVAMTHYADDIYYAEIAATFNTVIFNLGGDQTDDIPMTGWSTSTPMYEIGAESSSWKAVPGPAQYYLVGIIEGEDQWSVDSETLKFNVNTETDGEYYLHDVTFNKADEIKAIDSNGVWYPASGNNYYIEEAGHYDIYFRPKGNSDWGYYYLYVTPHVTPAP